MVYCTEAEVEAMVPQWPRSGWPSLFDLDQEIESIDAELNVILANRGMSVPYVSDTSNEGDAFYLYLGLLCRSGVTWRVVQSIARGSDDVAMWEDFHTAYEEGKKGLQSGQTIPYTVKQSEDSLGPSNINTIHPTDEVNDSLGSANQHAFYRSKSDTF